MCGAKLGVECCIYQICDLIIPSFGYILDDLIQPISVLCGIL